MRGNRSLNFLVMLTLAVLTATANAYAGPGGGGRGGGIGVGGGVGMAHGFEMSSGGNSGMGFGHVGGVGAPHSLSPEIATPGISHPGTLLGTNLGNSPAINAPYSTGIGQVSNRNGGYDMITPGAGLGLSRSGGIRPIEPDLVTRIGRDDGDMSRGAGRHDVGAHSPTDSLDRDVRNFDARLGLTPPGAPRAASDAQPQDQGARAGMRNASDKHQLTPRQQAILQAEQQAISPEDVNQELTIIGANPLPSSTTGTFGAPQSSANSSQPQATLTPDPSLSTALPPSVAATDQAIQAQLENTSAPLTADDLTSLRDVFFPSGTPSAAATTPQSTSGVALGGGSTLPYDIALYPLPQTALPSPQTINLGYFFNGQSIVIADFDTSSIVGVVNNGS
jgi:hypothetical protein